MSSALVPDRASDVAPGAAVVAATTELDGLLLLVVGSDGAILTARGTALPGRLAAATGRPYASVMHDLPQLADAVRVALGGAATTRRMSMPSGALELRAAPYRARGGAISGAVVVGTDARPLVAAERALAARDGADPVTGLPTGPALVRALEAAAAAAGHGEAVVVVHATVEHLPLVNAALGHEAGDALLRDAAERLAEALPEGALMGRSGGSGLVGIISGACGDGATAARDAVDRARSRLRGVAALGCGDAPRAATVGVAIAPRDGTDARELLGRAQGGPARDQAGAVRERLQIAARLQFATERDELSLVYQPIFSIAERRPYGVEALVRWNDGELGDVSPASLIAVAEETGAIHDLGAWVVERLCRTAQAWDHQDVRLQLHFNASPVELARPGYARDLLTTLRRHGLAATRFVLELNETKADTAGPCPERAVDALERLTAAGMQVALGGFGGDGSSLSRLRGVPATMVKLDRSLLAEVASDRVARAIVGSSIRMANELRMQVVAEGVETAAQEAYLLEHRCPLGQGFWFGRPAAAHGQARRPAAGAGTAVVGAAVV